MKAKYNIPIIVLVLSALFFSNQTASGFSLTSRWINIKSVDPNNAYILFQDDFNDGKQDGWTKSGPGTWSVDNGEYVVDMGTGINLNGISLAGNRAWRDYMYEVDVKGDAGVDKGILFRCNDVWDSCYYINLTGDPVNILSFGYLVDHVGVYITSAAYSNPNGYWYHVKIILSGRNVQVYVNDQFLINYTADDTHYVPQGMIGLSGFTGLFGSDIVRFDNVVVTGSLTQYLPIVTR